MKCLQDLEYVNDDHIGEHLRNLKPVAQEKFKKMVASAKVL